MKEFKRSSRKWLNPKGHYDTGAIQWDVRCSGSIHTIESDLSIWDCGKKITLNFSAYKPQDLKERAKKINLLISELEALRDALGEAYDYIDWNEPEDYHRFIEELGLDEY